MDMDIRSLSVTFFYPIKCLWNLVFLAIKLIIISKKTQSKYTLTINDMLRLLCSLRETNARYNDQITFNLT